MLKSAATGLISLTGAVAVVIWTLLLGLPGQRTITLNDLPTESTKPTAQNAVRLTTGADGKLRVNDDWMDRGEAYWRLAALTAQGQPTLVLTYDARTTALDISRMINLASESGFTSVYLKADPGTNTRRTE